MNRRRWILLFALALAVTLVILLGPDEATVLRESAARRDWACAHPLLALGLFFVAEVLLVALSVPVGIWMSALGGFLFGFWMGLAVVSLAALMGAILAFLAARMIFFDALHRLARSRPRFGRWLSAIDRGFQEHGAYYVLLLRLTPVIPFWAVNLGLGLSGVRLREYCWATLVGMLPATVVVVNAGASVAEIRGFGDLLSWRVLGALALLPIVPVVLQRTAGRWLASEGHNAQVHGQRMEGVDRTRSEGEAGSSTGSLRPPLV
jgi:uncharacterized membrane protein YdjX (TVP38/TMEM64 family)